MGEVGLQGGILFGGRVHTQGCPPSTSLKVFQVLINAELFDDIGNNWRTSAQGLSKTGPSPRPIDPLDPTGPRKLGILILGYLILCPNNNRWGVGGMGSVGGVCGVTVCVQGGRLEIDGSVRAEEYHLLPTSHTTHHIYKNRTKTK